MTATLTVRFLLQWVRRPVNVVLLVVVPVVFVALSAGVWATFARMVGSGVEAGRLVSATGGWAAAYLAGMAGFFHIAGSRAADARLAAAGTSTRAIVAARLLSGMVLALVGVIAALSALAARTGIGDAPRTVTGTVMFAAVYLGLGMIVGTAVTDEVSGAVLVLFVWMTDVFLGPAMAGGSGLVTRLLPTHFVTMVITGTAADHAGRLGNLGAALTWAALSAVVAARVMTVRTRPSDRAARRARWMEPGGRVFAGLRLGWLEYRRNPVLWALLVGGPSFLVAVSFVVTPAVPMPLPLAGDLVVVSRADLHALIMVPITVALIAGIAGVFVVLGSAEADRRLVLAGFRPGEVLLARLGVLAGVAALSTAASLLPLALLVHPRSWSPLIIASLLTAMLYALIGVLLGPVLGRLGGFYVVFLMAFIDPGLGQDYLLGAPPNWGAYLPGHGPVLLLLRGGFTGTVDIPALLLSLGWLAGITAAAAAVFRRLAAPSRA